MYVTSIEDVTPVTPSGGISLASAQVLGRVMWKKIHCSDRGIYDVVKDIETAGGENAGVALRDFFTVVGPAIIEKEDMDDVMYELASFTSGRALGGWACANRASGEW